MKVVADFWEDHCVECGEPACFGSCPKFRRGAHGRCRRVEFGDGGRVKFLEWGKLELLWHGRLATPDAARRLKEWNARWERVAKFLQAVFGWVPVAYGKGPYGIFRSVRWRKARRVAEFAEPPTKWIVEVCAETPLKLLLEVRSAALEVLLTRIVEVGVDARRVEIDLPKVEEGALFSIRPADANSVCEARIMRNELVAGEQGMVKCVAWDLDGVLWKGTLSEGDDVKLDEGVMDVMKALDERGVVSSICSKNDMDVAIAKLKELGVEEWFVFPQINWGPKSESLKRLAAEMNIGLDAIAFVDDREENRREVMERLPQVRVFAETDVAGLVSRVAPEAAPGTLGGARRKAYRAEMARRKAAETFEGDAEAFSAASGLKFELLKVEGERKARCRELVQRTNQLNLTARRYDEAAFDELVRTAECRAVRVWDRYGDYGVVGFVAWTPDRLRELVFSCRIAKKGVERRVLDMLPKGLAVDMVATERNAPIREIVAKWKNGN